MKKLICSLVSVQSKILNIFRRIYHKLSLKRTILLISFYHAYDSHLLAYYNSIQDKSKYKFLLYDDANDNRKERYEELSKFYKNCDIKILNRLSFCMRIALIGVDLAVIPSHGIIPIEILSGAKKLFIYHGTSTNLTDGELYAYNKNLIYHKNKCIYDIMLENNKLLSAELNENPLLKNKVVYSSSISNDIINDNIKNFKQCRKKLGVNDNDLFVFVYSTWNLESLFHKLGDNFLNQISNIKTINGKNVKFALSIHPREYSVYSEEIKPLGNKIDAMASDKIIIRKSGEDWLDYIIGSDIVIGDHSSLLDLAVMADKKIILSETNLDQIHDKSIVSLAYKYLPIFHKNENLENILSEIDNFPINDNLKLLKQGIFERKGYYSDTVTSITKQLLYQEKK